MKTLLLSATDVAKVINFKNVIEAVEKGYIAFNRGLIQQPPIQSMEMDEYNAAMDVKTCYNGLNSLISVKMLAGSHDNYKVDLPPYMGTVSLLSGKDGTTQCIMDAGLITGLRTGAAGALSCKYLARKDSEVVAVIGAGGQARNQIYALNELFDIKEIRVYNPKADEMPKYKEDVEREIGVKVTITESASEAMKGADIAISTTPAKEFLVEAKDVKPGMHIVAVGADIAGKNEWDPEIFRNARIFNDSKSQCTVRGETRNALVKGVITEEDIAGEIGQVIEGQIPGRTSDDEITIFDTVGLALQDNVTAEMIFETAVKTGMGTYFEF